jgi:hypothetical protein
MMPSKPQGADLSSMKELFAIAVFIESGNLVFKKLPNMGDFSLDAINELIDVTSPKPIQPQKILNVTTGVVQKTKTTVSSLINYTKPSISKIVKDSKEKDISAYLYDPVYRNGQRFDSDGNTIKTELTVLDFVDTNVTLTKYAETFLIPAEYVNSIPVIKVYDKYKNRIQTSYLDGALKANEVIMASLTDPFYLPITISDSTHSRTEKLPVFQLDIDGNRPVTFFDKFGNTVVSIENNMLRVKRTKIPLAFNDKGEPIAVDVKKNSLENKRLLDVIA